MSAVQLEKTVDPDKKMPRKPQDMGDVGELKKKEEAGLRYRMKKCAQESCEVELAAFVECDKGRSISTVWACREQFNAYNNCLKQYTTPEIFDRMAKEYMDERDAKYAPLEKEPK
mmetsp:Transcript_2044/g.4752  ORF Transcript_2044/g.4752 Transcript_2044/m.4752 type:complete len:115 (+) Transcript_2044:134-478(+)|eukprot:CAMPEP_0177648668 /NCGR_PEP_ID=MMETSP0447-20121125/10951_1 /TAXON_ID=0 /ORGANISM="Stygamoeba regulata, Strain BSH-02190019" /LENGTH=114 /DNA_ID=CAMNT_0019151325 /DNA_START=104 /DNA_END=448 /DNA_ORIENTATION=-